MTTAIREEMLCFLENQLEMFLSAISSVLINKIFFEPLYFVSGPIYHKQVTVCLKYRQNQNELIIGVCSCHNITVGLLL